MFTIIRTITRPSKDISFFPPGKKDPVEEKTFYEDYVKTGKFISSHEELSEDELVLTQTSQWRSRDEYISYLLTESVIRKTMNSHRPYQIKNNIISVFTSPHVGEP